ncbi:PRC-barrel domain-containing protein [uncultured Cohaesibacter sp.]|uniref:PRC-barrel domain-containing protein n=1 Tax=uncultured Cohaesibacter sp. TaxID=1002546 RepID=UPI0029C7B078|nr:PRC-barrel domain-containing protein [uncultured Cohaesibacter sp.]
MKRILATTALGLMLTTAAMAETPMGSFKTIDTVAQNDIFASNFIGKRIYSAEQDYDGFGETSTVDAGTEQNWEDLGEVNDIILDREGNVKAVVLGVGGFLGVGEKDVAVDMNSIKMVTETEDPDDFFLVVNTNRETLENAQEFERPMVETTAAVGINSSGMSATVEESTEAAKNSYESMKQDVQEGYDSAKQEMSETYEDSKESLNTALNESKEGLKTAYDKSKEKMASAYDETRDLFVAPDVDLEGYEVALDDQLNADDLTGARLYDSEDKDIGEVDQLVLKQDGTIDKAVLDVGGFLGVNEHRIAVNMDELQIMRSSESGMVRVYIDASQEELEAQPEYQS